MTVRALMAIAAAAIALHAHAQDRAWAIQVPDARAVAFRGLANFDAAGQGTGSILYPAPGVAGLVAAIVAHGLVVEGLKSSQRNEIQTKADDVLIPYRPILDGYSYKSLFESGLSRLPIAGSKRVIAQRAEAAASEWVIETVPIYAMTLDRRALVLDNAIAVYAEGRAEPAYRNVVRVVSNPFVDKEGDDGWGVSEGRRLKDVSAQMWAESLEIAVAQMTQMPGEAPSKTVRFPQGGDERIERAQVLVERCDRMLIKTLRGEIMSVPRKGGTCAAAPAAIPAAEPAKQ